MYLLKLLFSFHGRLDRRTFQLVLLCTLVSGAVLGPVLVQLVFSPLGIGEVSILILLIIFIWATFALTAKRLHDLDMSGWWCLVTLGIPIPLAQVVL